MRVSDLRQRRQSLWGGRYCAGGSSGGGAGSSAWCEQSQHPPPNPSATTARLTDEHNDQQDAESQDEAQQAGLPVPSSRPGRGGRRQHNGVRGEVIERVGGCQKP
jgi:hypothetical protein